MDTKVESNNPSKPLVVVRTWTKNKEKSSDNSNLLLLYKKGEESYGHDVPVGVVDYRGEKKINCFLSNEQIVERDGEFFLEPLGKELHAFFNKTIHAEFDRQDANIVYSRLLTTIHEQLIIGKMSLFGKQNVSQLTATIDIKLFEN